eukprot:Gregarina_sp_Poly_1__250@NODE_1059_length_5209_cov_75_678919_g737_i0_p3_GENE_NODE_1059_length_5209_cov_75_678919_g737_i0NODE_1059_length_5209_cov_75_678919_g737_i0_p3_ORF_typecomplete_len406_score51_39IMP2_N/PF18590_1/7_2e20IMP2_C/PF18591_1/0_17_NODE_1059_length_5209_cov_75_678919_g737_i039375154
MGSGSSTCKCCQSAEGSNSKITVKRDPPKLAVRQSTGVVSPSEPLANKHAKLMASTYHGRTPSTPSFRGDSDPIETTSLPAPEDRRMPAKQRVGREQRDRENDFSKLAAEQSSQTVGAPISHEVELPDVRLLSPEPSISPLVGPQVTISSLSSASIRKMAKKAAQLDSASSESSDRPRAKVDLAFSHSSSGTTPSSSRKAKEIINILYSSSSSSLSRQLADDGEASLASHEVSFTRNRIAITVNAQSFEAGCYLQFSSVGQGVLSALWSKTYPTEGIFLAFMRPGKQVPAFKFKGSSRRQDLVKAITTNKTDYFRGWISFVKLARAHEGSIIFMEGINEVPPVKLIIVDSGNRLHTLQYNVWEDLGGACAVAAVPGGSDVFSGINSLNPTLLVQKANEIGSSSLL